MLLQMALFHSFLGLNNIQYICTIFSFIHSSNNGHLVCFHVLFVVNNATRTLGYMYHFKLVLSRYMPRSGIAGSYGSSFAVF